MTASIRQSVEAALRSLTPIWDDGNRLMLSVPVRYPSGALASIEASAGRETVWLSDRGYGRYEAEMCAAETSFAISGRLAAARHGIEFDGYSIFAAKLPLEQLAGGIVAVANASVLAAGEAIRSEAEKRTTEQNDLIQRKLRQAFPEADIIKKLAVAGERAEWDAHNVIRLGDRLAVFEAVSPSPQSISSKYLMFSDLARRPNISLNAVVPKVSELGNKGLMLADVAHIIDAEAPVESYRAAA